MISTKKNSKQKGSGTKSSQPFFSKKGRRKPVSNKQAPNNKKEDTASKTDEQKKPEKKDGEKKSRLKKIGHLLSKSASSFNPFKRKKRNASNASATATKGEEPKKNTKEDEATKKSSPSDSLSKESTTENQSPDVKQSAAPTTENTAEKPIAAKTETIAEPSTENTEDKKADAPTELSKETKEEPPTEPAPAPKAAAAAKEKEEGKEPPKEEPPKAEKGAADGKQEKPKAKDAKAEGGAKDKKPPKEGGGGGGASIEEATPPEPTLDATSSDGLVNSLSTLKPTGFAQGMKQAGPLAANIQQKEKTDLKEDLPEIEQPTGLPVKGEAPSKKEKTTLKKEQAPDLGVKGSKEKQQIELTHPQTTAKANIANVPTPRPPAGEDKSFFESAIKQGVKNLKTTDSSINTSAGERPNIELSGEANPEQNQQNQEQSDTKINEEQTKADTEVTKDFGEQDIYPEMEREMLSPQIELSAPPAAVNTELGDVPGTSAEVYTAFDLQAQEHMDGQIQVEMTKHEAEREKMEQDSEKEKLDGQQKIDEETARVKAEQEAEQNKAKGEVGQHRENWKKENEAVKTEYAGKSAAKKKEIDGQIDSKVQETDTKVEKKLNQAEKDAEAEKKKTEEEARRKKKEAEEKNKKRSFWDRVASAISDFFDALKSALNTLFDGLRSLVKGIIELAKKAVNGLIELARTAIVGFIKAFGEALKAFVSVALAAFPEIANRINGLIDKAVDAAVNIVNKLAEGLKKIANALLDAIGAVLDAILAAYQAFYNLMLDALKFIAVGIIKILEGIANLVSAAGQSPDHFFGQMSEELLGQDVTKPLPNERPPQTAPATDQIAQAKEHGEISDADAAFLSKSTYADGDIQVDGVAANEEFSPELMSQLAASGDGVIEFGASNDQEHSMDAVKQDMMGGGAPTPANDPVASGTNQAAPAPQPTTQEGGDGLVGPFSGPSERAGYLLDQMWQGVKKWFSENKVAIIAALVLGITGVILANIITGGAIMAALPLLMQIVSVYFAAEAIFKISTYFGKYLGSAFPGQIAEGAKHLARGLAAGAIELVFALLFGGKAAVKAVKAGAKAAAKGGVKGVVKAGKSAAKSAAKNYVKTNVKAAKELGKVAKNGAKATLKNGKAVVKGVKNGFSKGAKKLDDLGKRLSKKFRFKKFKLEVKNRKWRLLGQMNPWVLLANGKVEEIDQDKLKRMDGSTDTSRLGDMVYVNGRKQGVVVGVNSKASSFVNELTSTSRSKAQNIRQFRSLKGEVDSTARKAVIQARESTANLRGGIIGPQPLNFQAHHIVPRQVAKKFDAFFKKIKFDFDDGAINGIMMPPDKAALAAAIKKNPALKKTFGKSAFHKGSHPDYTNIMDGRISGIEALHSAGKLTDAQAYKRVMTQIGKAKKQIQKSGGAINDVTF
ncbi:MAG: AHH domain-containing protein [Bacteroidota bacterium]